VWEKILKPTWNKLRKPLWILLVLLATVVIPDGIMVWLVMYISAQNIDRVREPTVFLSLTFQLTAALSLYTVFWGLWLYPKLKPWLRPQMRNVTELSISKQTNGQEKVLQPPTEGKGGIS
jgi:membrane protein implicated in regulation of membrane protease activity